MVYELYLSKAIIKKIKTKIKRKAITRQLWILGDYNGSKLPGLSIYPSLHYPVGGEHGF